MACLNRQRAAAAAASNERAAEGAAGLRCAFAEMCAASEKRVGGRACSTSVLAISHDFFVRLPVAT